MAFLNNDLLDPYNILGSVRLSKVRSSTVLGYVGLD